MVFRLITRLSKVPDGATVTKITGSKTYRVRRSLAVFTESGGERKQIKCDDGFVFLVQENGDVNAVLESKEVCWHASEYDVRELLDPAEDR